MKSAALAQSFLCGGMWPPIPPASRAGIKTICPPARHAHQVLIPGRPQIYTGPVQISVKLTKDTLSPAIAKALRAVADPKPALEAAAMVIVKRAVRAFNEPGVRPAPWQALKASTLAAKARTGKSDAILKRDGKSDAILKRDGVLWRSIRISGLTKARVTVGTDRFYAHFHQLGTRTTPARPFFPFDKDGKLEAAADDRVQAAIRIKLGVE